MTFKLVNSFFVYPAQLTKRALFFLEEQKKTKNFKGHNIETYFREIIIISDISQGPWKHERREARINASLSAPH